MEPFTAVPNWLIEAMPQMPASVFQVAMVIARQTAGYTNGDGGRKEWDRISLSQFQEATGLSRQGVIDAIENGNRKYFERRQNGQYFEYKLVNSVDQLDSEVVNSLDQQLVKPVDQSAPKLVNSVDPQKKETTKQRSKQKKKSVLSPNGKSPPRDSPAVPSEHQLMFEKLCDIVGWDHRTLDKESKGQVAQTLGILKKAGYTLTDLNEFGDKVWRHDWRWTEKHSRPTLKQVRQEIGKLRELDSVELSRLDTSLDDRRSKYAPDDIGAINFHIRSE